MITRLALWTAGALAVGLLAGALAVTLAIRPQVLAQTVPTYSLPGLYSAAFDGAGIQANAIVAGDGSTAWQIPPSALAPTPAEDRWLKTASDDATATEWAELPENRLLPEYLNSALAGRFLSVTTIDNANPRAEWVGISQWPGHASVTPVEIAHNTGAFTMRATLDRVSGTFPAGAQMRLVAYTRTGDFVHAVANDFSTPATLTYTADQTTALLLQARNHTLVATLQVYDDNQATTLLAELPVYITVRQIADAPVIPYRFEAAVGSSPSTLPVGTHTIVATAKLTTGTDTVKYSRTFLVSDLSTASELWSMDTGNPSSYSDNRDFTISLAYNPTSRALTYTWTTGLQRTTISEQSIKAIGVTQ